MTPDRDQVQRIAYAIGSGHVVYRHGATATEIDGDIREQVCRSLRRRINEEAWSAEWIARFRHWLSLLERSTASLASAKAEA